MEVTNGLNIVKFSPVAKDSQPGRQVIFWLLGQEVAQSISRRQWFGHPVGLISFPHEL